MTIQISRFLLAAIASFVIVGVANAEQLSVDETAKTIVVRQGDRDVLTYNKLSPPLPEGIDPVFRRSGCIHPLRTPQGRVVTEMFPFDHPHQHGVYCAWVKTLYDGQMVDFWNLARKTGLVSHQRVVNVFQEQHQAGFEVDLIHQALFDPPVDVLRERWKITVHQTDGDSFRFDLETKQTALTDKPLMVSKNRYGGLAVRGPSPWLASNDKGREQRPDYKISPSGFLNDLGSNRIQGNHQHSRWVSLWGELDGHPVSTTVMSHASNLRAPQAARLHPTKPYFCFAPCVDDSFVIDKQNPYVGKYRFLITDARPDPKWIEKQWQVWCNQ